MNIFNKILENLSKDDCRFIVVGGFAAVLHGNNRLTSDIDLVMDLEKSNIDKTVDCLNNLGLKSRLPVDPKQLSDKGIRDSWIHEKNMIVFSFYDPSLPLFAVDLMIAPPIEYKVLEINAKLIKMNNFHFKICSIDDLIKMKEISAREQDKLDIQNLKLLKK